MKRIALVAATLLASTALPATAAPIVYTFSGDFTGTLADVPFTANATFTGVGDTATAFMSGLTKFVPLTSLTIAGPGGPYTVTTTTQFYFNGGNYAGLFFGSNGTGGGSFSGGPIAGYDGVSNLATTSLANTFGGFAFFHTDQGDVFLNSFTNGTFGAAVSGAVPEPATWAMMLAGFGMVGAGMRRRAKVRTTVSYA